MTNQQYCQLISPAAASRSFLMEVELLFLNLSSIALRILILHSRSCVMWLENLVPPHTYCPYPPDTLIRFSHTHRELLYARVKSAVPLPLISLPNLFLEANSYSSSKFPSKVPTAPTMPLAFVSRVNGPPRMPIFFLPRLPL